MSNGSSTFVFYSGHGDFEPRYATEHAAGADLKAALDAPCSIEPGRRFLVSTGLCLAIPEGWEGQVRPRSGLVLAKGLTVLNAPGTIDSDYRGEVKVVLINLGDRTVTVEPGERIAQLVITPVSRVRFIHSVNLSESRRGDGGFGSTGS